MMSLNCAPMNSFATIAPPGFSIVAAKVSAQSISSRERASSRIAIPVSFGARSLVTRSARPPSSLCTRAATAGSRMSPAIADRAGRRILHRREIDSHDASARARRRDEYRQPSAGRASQIDDSRAFADEPVARDYFFNLERRTRRQSHRARLAVKFVVWFVGRHKFIRSLCRARRSRYLDRLRSEVLKLRRSP